MIGDPLRPVLPPIDNFFELRGRAQIEQFASASSPDLSWFGQQIGIV